MTEQMDPAGQPGPTPSTNAPPPPTSTPPPPTASAQSARFGPEAEYYAQQARQAHDFGLLYFQIRIALDHVGSTHDYSAKGNPTIIDNRSPSAILTAIALQGWKVISSGYTFRQHAESSTYKFFSDGSHTAVHGTTIATYLFEPA